MSGDVQPSRLSVEELAAAIGVTPERWRMKFIADYVLTPQKELMHRLNLRLKGVQPGPAIHRQYWRVS